jgi:hypothetical protein
LGFERKSLPTKYLGIPLTEKAYKLSTWQGIVNKLQNRVKTWMYRSLNLAGRLILTKSVLQDIPTFMMSVFLAPKGILQKIITIQREFLCEEWKQGKNGHWWLGRRFVNQKSKEAWGYTTCK